MKLNNHRKYSDITNTAEEYGGKIQSKTNCWSWTELESRNLQGSYTEMALIFRWHLDTHPITGGGELGYITHLSLGYTFQSGLGFRAVHAFHSNPIQFEIEYLRGSSSPSGWAWLLCTNNGLLAASNNWFSFSPVEL